MRVCVGSWFKQDGACGALGRRAFGGGFDERAPAGLHGEAEGRAEVVFDAGGVEELVGGLAADGADGFDGN